GADRREVSAGRRDRRRSLRAVGPPDRRGAHSCEGGMTMARSNKPMVWAPFAAGGTLTALLIPALILLTLFAALGSTPVGLSYDHMHAFAGRTLGTTAIVR